MPSPTPKQAMGALLSDSLDLRALVDRRIYVDQARQNDANYLLYQVVSDIQPKGMSTILPCRSVRFQLTARLDKRADAEAAAAVLVSLLDGKSNATLGGLLVKSSLVNVDEGAADEDESPRPGEESGNRVVRLDVNWNL